MNSYIAFFNNQRHELNAPSLYAAELKAIEHFKPKKSQQHMVHVHLTETPQGPVTHSTASLP